MREVVALEQQRLIGVDRERIGEAVAEVEPGRMPRCFAEVAICLPGDAGLGWSDGGNLDPHCGQERIQPARGCGIALAVDHDARLQIVAR